MDKIKMFRKHKDWKMGPFSSMMFWQWIIWQLQSHDRIGATFQGDFYLQLDTMGFVKSKRRNHGAIL